MDRDAGKSDRGDEAQQGDTGMIGSESEEPGPGRDTSLTDPDPVASSTDQPRGTVAMSEGDPMRTRLGSQIEGAGVIGYDVAASEEGATQDTPADDRPGYEPERPGGDAAAEPVEEVRPSGGSVFDDQPAAIGQSAFASEADRPGDGGSLFTDEEPERLDRPGPQEPGVEDGVYDHEADQDRPQRPSNGL